MERLLVLGVGPPIGSFETAIGPFDASSGDRLAWHAGLSSRSVLRALAECQNILATPIVEATDQHAVKGRAAARRIRHRLAGRGVLLLGSLVPYWLDLPVHPYMAWRRAQGFAYATIPHPSGCSRPWHDKALREAARPFLREALGLVPDVDGLALSPAEPTWSRLLREWHKNEKRTGGSLKPRGRGSFSVEPKSSTSSARG